MGRIPNAHDASYVSGAATLVAVLGTHAALTRLRLIPGLASFIEREPRLLIAHGRLLTGELRRCGLTRADLKVVLRQQGPRRSPRSAMLCSSSAGRSRWCTKSGPAPRCPSCCRVSSQCARPDARRVTSTVLPDGLTRPDRAPAGRRLVS
ncbi:hypothetical protein ACFQY5_40345 [Paeniroseomonas aquatica]|uniref:hypothetical protein n=1 Tax=Paeniroseomonas aquatica TaxID=373043 RepID=UPI0036176B91